MLMLSVASIGLAANLLSVLLLEKDSHGNINIKSSYLHLLSDTISSFGVVLGGIAVKLWNIVWIDPLITAFISIYILKETWGIIVKTTAIFMQSSPHIDLEELKKTVEEIDGVKNIHHIHAWLYSESDIYFEAHIDMDNIKISEAEKIYEKTGEILKEKYGIKHVTLQAEVDRCMEKGIIKKHNE
jgi:cobalt-zinc-cadmium efflux system protein